MDFATQLDELSREVARLASENEISRKTAMSFHDELSQLKAHNQKQDRALGELADKFDTLHALTKEMRQKDYEFQKSSFETMESLHSSIKEHQGQSREGRAMLAEQQDLIRSQGGDLAKIAQGVTDALTRANGQREAMAEAKKWRLLGAILLSIGSLLAGVLTGHNM